MRTAAYIIEIRVKQWMKEAFVAAPLFFGFRFVEPESLLRGALACVSFALAASCIYVLNDIVDAPQDRLHPAKKNRPIASGAISIYRGWALSLMLATVSFTIALLLDSGVLTVVLAYVGANVLYTFYLKRLAIIDVMMIALGFFLRLLAGALAVHVELSRWMILATFFLSLFIGFGKRRTEMATHSQDGAARAVLSHYSLRLIGSLMNISATLTIMTYALHAAFSTNFHEVRTDWFLITIPFVVYGIFRYLYLVEKMNEGEDPAELVVHDAPLRLSVILWSVTVLILLVLEYLKRNHA
jgi:4-hydroxybenzoate polyprenyltransferase